jgi:hypothetical protein
MGRRRIGPLLLVIALAVAGCASASAVNTGNGASDPSHISCTVDYAVEYTSLAGLRRAATAVAVLRPTGQATVRSIDSIPITIAKVKILTAVAGSPLPATLGLREDGRPGDLGGCAPLVSGNNVYLAYLVAFRLRRNGPPINGQYVSVGGAQGLFRHVGSRSLSDTSARSFVRLAPAGIPLPPRISILEAKRS